MSVIILTTGVPGCGKTYIRCARFLVDDFLVNTNGVHISNYPVNIPLVSETVSKKINKHRGFFGIFRKPVTPQDISKRIEIIPDDVLQSWRAGLSGPWDYFSGRDLKYCHIAIDEIHNFVNSRCSDQYIKMWDDFLGEVRHRGCTFEALTQDISQVDSVISGRASVRLELVPAEDLRDPFFKIKLSDWYELKACLTGDYHKTTFVYEKRRQDSRWKTNHVYRFLITPDYFAYYNSYSASLQEKEKGSVNDDRAPLHEYQKRSRVSLIFWFFRRNFFTLLFRIFLAVFVIWLCFFGGLTFFLNRWLFVSNKSFESQKINSSKKTSVASSPFSASPSVSHKSSSDSSALSLDQQKYQDQKKEIIENAFTPALFFYPNCWLQNGIRVYEGYVFTDKVFSGRFFEKKVVSIDFSDRFYVLDDGTRVYQLRMQK